MRKKRKLGPIFPDQVYRATSKTTRLEKDPESGEWEDVLLPNYKPRGLQETVSTWRLITLVSILLFFFFGLFLRLFHLQVVSGQENRQIADLNRVQIRLIHGPRGVIYDRNSKVLAENNPGFRLEGKFISRDEALKLEAKNDSKFNQLEVDTIRSYPQGVTTSSILGYVGEITGDELKNDKYKNYRAGDRIGRAGVEQIYESTLRGIDGAEIIEIDANGKKIRSLRRIDPVPGNNIYLSIDADLQKIAFEELKKGIDLAKSCCGALVAENPKTGAVLSLISYPTFDANAFTDPKRSDEIAGYFSDVNSPLLNRVISGVYPPGSTFKIVTSLAGLSSGKITGQTQIEDTGEMYLGPFKFSNWYFTGYGKKEGLVDIVKALQRSNDIYFYQVGRMVGEKEIEKAAKKLGMGKKLGIDLPGEANGLVPNGDWKQKNIGESWYPGDTLHLAIGQGYLLTTPLQILAQTSFVASDGILVQPRLVSKITSPAGNTIKSFSFEPIEQNIFKKYDLDLVKKGLSLVPKMGGTAWPFFTFSIPTAGKTGTAEFGDPKGRTHAWYTSYAPENDPQIALTVLVEAGGEGSSDAAPIAKQIYTWYFNPDKTHVKSLDIAPISTDAAKLGE